MKQACDTRPIKTPADKTDMTPSSKNISKVMLPDSGKQPSSRKNCLQGFSDVIIFKTKLDIVQLGGYYFLAVCEFICQIFYKGPDKSNRKLNDKRSMIFAQMIQQLTEANRFW